MSDQRITIDLRNVPSEAARLLAQGILGPCSVLGSQLYGPEEAWIFEEECIGVLTALIEDRLKRLAQA
jgi:hypothetical protein